MRFVPSRENCGRTVCNRLCRHAAISDSQDRDAQWINHEGTAKLLGKERPIGCGSWLVQRFVKCQRQTVE